MTFWESVYVAVVRGITSHTQWPSHDVHVYAKAIADKAVESCDGYIE